MALIPWHKRSSRLPTPEFTPMASLQRDINRMFDDFFSEGGFLRDSASGAFGSYLPALDIAETNTHVDVTAEIPGMTDKDIKVVLSENGEMLTIEGEKRSEQESKTDGMFCQERSYGRFRRVVALPHLVDDKHVEATCRNGVLRVHMQKLPEQQQRAKQIPIKSA